MERRLNLWLRSIFIIIISSFFLQKVHVAYSATGVGTVRQYVPGALSIYKISDMDFGVAAPGAARLRLPNDNLETPENASFRIQGEARQTVTTSFPTGSIFLTEPVSGDQIEVNRFRTRPGGQSGGTVRIRNTGERLLFVSAQRLFIPNNSTPGLYSGSFVVDVVY
jgi:hypothetical protein